jgi:hypothetical protein
MHVIQVSPEFTTQLMTKSLPEHWTGMGALAATTGQATLLPTMT